MERLTKDVLLYVCSFLLPYEKHRLRATCSTLREKISETPLDVAMRWLYNRAYYDAFFTKNAHYIYYNYACGHTKHASIYISYRCILQSRSDDCENVLSYILKYAPIEIAKALWLLGEKHLDIKDMESHALTYKDNIPWFEWIMERCDLAIKREHPKAKLFRDKQFKLSCEEQQTESFSWPSAKRRKRRLVDEDEEWQP